ncbi:CRISPR-associated helicase Cas3' [Actinoallomurus sp. CA-150999]|uniref:CRISPR-associated helicase Cas3' n=1 Tax=Actinoallomurus sp. CA-150999 TaxID=3239887 RepID=UPI003D9101D5
MPEELSAFYAKSSQAGRPAEPLTDHLAAALAAAGWLRQRVGAITAVDASLGRLFWTAVELAALTHDAGKIAGGFQDMVTGARRTWGERHEVLSLGFLPSLIHDPELLLWVATAVATHHRPLGNQPGRDLSSLYHPYDLDELRERFGKVSPAAVHALDRWLSATARSAGLPAPAPTQAPLDADDLPDAAHQMLDTLLEHWADRATPGRGLTAVLLQGAVILADHLSSAHKQLSFHQPLDGSFPGLLDKRFTDDGKVLRPHQRRAAAASGHLLLRAPTGSGKTEAVLLWSANQVTALQQETGGVPRVFFVLPYLSSINAMADRLKNLLGTPDAVGVAHSKAASYHLAAAITPEDSAENDDPNTSPHRVDAATKAVARAAATRLFHESVRVTTPYQLLRGALAGNAHSAILIDAANSVFVLDELHVYDPRRLGYLLATAQLWERLGGRIAIVSATLPDLLARLFTQTLNTPPVWVGADDLHAPPRHRLSIRNHHLTDASALAEIRHRLQQHESVLVVANNVAQALELFEELAPQVQDQHGQDAALLLHSRFRRRDRSLIETKITQRFGAASQPQTRRPGLLVATQCVEVSLDLDFDVLLTAAAPLEALLQRFGRVNRLAERPPADVIVHQPNWTTRRTEPGEFADGIYPREPVEAAWQILLDNDGRPIDETDAITWLNTIYATNWGSQWQAEVLERQETFTRDFLTFRRPFDDRSTLTEAFDALFDGSEAVLTQDHDAYAAALNQGPHNMKAGRLLADEYLIPMPHWAESLSGYEKELKIRLIDGDYDPILGLRAVQGPARSTYQPGEVL